MPVIRCCRSWRRELAWHSRTPRSWPAACDGVTADGVEDALARYAKARIPRTSAIQGGSRANDFLREANSGLSTEAVYRYDPWQVELPA